MGMNKNELDTLLWAAITPESEWILTETDVEYEPDTEDEGCGGCTSACDPSTNYCDKD
jgi:hypothetical protein